MRVRTQHHVVDARRGFALPAAVLVIAIFIALALFGIGLLRQQQRTSFRLSSRTSAFYTADLGLSRGLDRWGPARAATVAPGEELTLDAGSLANGASYSVSVSRLDDGTADNPLFLIRSVGTSRLGVEREANLTVTAGALDLETTAAIRSRGALRISGTADVSGFNETPPGWSDCPAADPPSLPGIVMADTTGLQVNGSATYDGDPPLSEDPDTAGMYQFGDLSFEELAELASFRFGDGAHISSTDPQPGFEDDGSCAVTDSTNWGSPLDPDGACGDWFPLIYAEGNMTLSGSGAGQGILLVAGDLDVTGGVEFFGPVVVKGKVKSSGGGFHFHGGLTAGSTDLKDETVLSGSTRIQYSACSLRRALTLSPAARALPLPERPWFGGR